jgi:hypothetical protein
MALVDYQDCGDNRSQQIHGPRCRDKADELHAQPPYCQAAEDPRQNISPPRMTLQYRLTRSGHQLPDPPGFPPAADTGAFGTNCTYNHQRQRHVSEPQPRRENAGYEIGQDSDQNQGDREMVDERMYLPGLQSLYDGLHHSPYASSGMDMNATRRKSRAIIAGSSTCHKAIG